jgi:hypothetical protein
LRPIFIPGTSVFVGWSNDCYRMLPPLPSRTTRLYMCAYDTNESILFVTYRWAAGYSFWCEKNSDTRKHSINTRKELKVFRPGPFVRLEREIRCVGSMI